MIFRVSLSCVLAILAISVGISIPNAVSHAYGFIRFGIFYRSVIVEMHDAFVPDD